jgi:5'-methylthioadenosine phosphorylase
MTKWVIGVIGGSGVYDFDGLADSEWRAVDTPWGRPSDKLRFSRIGEVDVVFLPRHGRGHVVPPHEVNYRANIAALKKVGVTDVISVSACGSFREELAPGTFVLVDQFIDRTTSRPASFFGAGLVAHVSMATPVSDRLVTLLQEAARRAGIACRKGGTYVAMEGPQFSSLAESRLYRQWGCDVIGMTAMPEAKLAREAELGYATVAMVTDYDCWHDDHAAVDVEAVVRILVQNATTSQALLRSFLSQLPRERPPCPQGFDRVLDTAMITAPDKRDPVMVEKLRLIAGRVLIAN